MSSELEEKTERLLSVMDREGSTAFCSTPSTILRG